MLAYILLQMLAWMVGILAIAYLLFHGGAHSWAIRKIKRTQPGAWAIIQVEGDDRPDIYRAVN